MDKLAAQLWRQFHQACASYSLLEDGDRILIGLSGGKDSLLLTELLGRQAQIFRPRIEIQAVHVRIPQRAYLSDLSYLEQFCAQYQVPFAVLDTTITPLPASASPSSRSKDPCFLCSWYRRKALLDYAQLHHFNKIALGHHRDDILQTLIMNLVYQGSFSTIMPRLALDKMPLEWIRPLCLIDEKDVREYAASQGYVQPLHECEYERESSRTWAKEQLAQWEQVNPNIRASLWHAIQTKKRLL